jgi:DNA-directed RNA polymerase specialized sigma24 family protein
MDLPPFQTLLDAYSHDVHRFLIANVGRSDADDCYQETWIAALRAYPGLRYATNLRGWLLTIAARKAIDVHRARGRGAVAMADPPEPSVVAASGGWAASGNWAAGGGWTVGSGPGDSDGDGVWDAVSGLPPKQRAAVVLRFLLDAEYPTVAATMGISEAAARRNVHEGLKRLREEHGHEWTA